MRKDDWITKLHVHELVSKPRFYIDTETEIQDCVQLAEELYYLADSKTLMVVCSPDYSSLCSQIVNHHISKISKGHLPLDMVYLNMPYPTQDLETFKDEITSLLERSKNYDALLFIDSGILRGLNFQTLKKYTDQFTYRSIYVCLYKKSDSVFIPDHYVKEFDKSQELVFWWEDADNPNWK